MTISRPRLLLGIAIGATILIVILANAHLVYVATTTEPQCVAHVKGGDPGQRPGAYSAARPSC